MKINWNILWKCFRFAVIAVTLFVIFIVATQRDYIQVFVYIGAILMATSALYFFKTVTTDYFASMLYGGVIILIISFTLLFVSVLLTKIFGVNFLNMRFIFKELKFIW